MVQKAMLEETHSVQGPGPGDALLIVDVQNDFLPGGRLPVPHGHEVIPPLNRILDLFRRLELPVYASRDWHPENHCSFQNYGGPWPQHCVAETEGARFARELDLPESVTVISKADTTPVDAYSAFENTDLGKRLKQSSIKRLFIGGLATDYCVLNTVKDARKNGFQVVLLTDAIRAVNVQPQDGARAEAEMIALGAVPAVTTCVCGQVPSPGPLLTDLYQLTMLKSYQDSDMNGQAVFEFFVRSLPDNRNFLMAAGLEQVLQYLETLRFSPTELNALTGSGRFSTDFLHMLEGLRFTGDVDALPEGTVFFADEPILRISAPLPEAQLIETRIINILQYQCLVATKAARMILAAPGKTLVDFGLRRAHGSEAGLFAARASFIAGFAGSATVPAEPLYGVPLFGTMAHSFILAHEEELRAFEDFARSWPDNAVLLLDTYDTETAAHRVVTLARKLKKEGIRIRAVRLDSGNLGDHSRKVRAILDAADLQEIKILASGGLDEYAIESLVLEGAPIDGYGVGTRLVVCEDSPSLDCAYKLQEYDGQPRRKLSEGKATWPGIKQVIRIYDEGGRFREDHLVLEGEKISGDSLLTACMRSGRRTQPPVPLAQSRNHAAKQLENLPEGLRSLSTSTNYQVQYSNRLVALADELKGSNSG